MELTLKKDIEVATKLLRGKPLEYDERNNYGQLYPWTNENIKSYYDYKDLTDKTALCITSSGDHILYAAASGATDIDSFDKNRLCKYYSALKIATILAYSEKDFNKVFIGKRKRLLSHKINIEDFKDYISPECYIFWKELLKEKNFKKNDILFRHDGIWGYINYGINYEKIKEALKNTKINYFDMNADEFLEYTNKKYDAIFLSNISEWQSSEYSSYVLIRNYLKLLKEDGVLYDYILKRGYISNFAKGENLEKQLGKALIYKNKETL